MIKVILIIFLLTTSASFSACKYSATADVKDNQLVNKVEKYVCEEDVSFFVKFWTTDEWVRPATYTFLFILDNL
jgi:hypothetical protein|tara:strand:+ start:732 stop:953 length:222 start_codon:yes stop_codon:yes gene_type:complete